MGTKYSLRCLKDSDMFILTRLSDFRLLSITAQIYVGCLLLGAVLSTYSLARIARSFRQLTKLLSTANKNEIRLRLNAMDSQIQTLRQFHTLLFLLFGACCANEVFTTFRGIRYSSMSLSAATMEVFEPVTALVFFVFLVLFPARISMGSGAPSAVNYHKHRFQLLISRIIGSCGIASEKRVYQELGSVAQHFLTLSLFRVEYVLFSSAITPFGRFQWSDKLLGKSIYKLFQPPAGHTSLFFTFPGITVFALAVWLWNIGLLLWTTHPDITGPAYEHFRWSCVLTHSRVFLVLDIAFVVVGLWIVNRYRTKNYTICVGFYGMLLGNIAGLIDERLFCHALYHASIL
jgi:hypothetical protein